MQSFVVFSVSGHNSIKYGGKIEVNQIHKCSKVGCIKLIKSGR